ncbi:helix-turn-helix transcriptional regulator [Psychroflexus sediminis]|uniref:Predicted DNA-binding transcriptional regulator YafY, contains an HTH and WYL domains n=1 Tax=Psychroflexus sediminis TaxID=470826 RepID=A0A1G7VYY2_9FLAO|nr:WYL domain-containing protein [Psychroflexus sediminis]SDG64985.1 Predicted DNA-binding transcriptional regulator YafY, contains an HTH and WYL domains [Psychroflexus sediminis]
MPVKLNNKLKRLYILVNHLNRKPATAKALLGLLEKHDLSVGIATFERDKKTLKEDFGIELGYEASDHTYSLAVKDQDEVAQLIQFLQFNQLSEALSAGILEGKLSLNCIDFENEQQLQGIEYLDRLLMATKNRQVIEIAHRKCSASKVITYTLKPYLLKQYQGRWYVVGEVGKNKIRTLGIDRIEALVLRQKTFEPKNYPLKEKFRGCVGVSQINKEKELILIAFENSQSAFLEHAPLHRSQKLIRSTRTHVVYGYYVVINDELRQLILKYGAMAKVLEPLSLAQEIRNELKKAYEAY